MSRRPAPSQGDRHTHGSSRGVPVFTAQRGPRVVAVPDLAEGEVRCPVCRAGTSLTASGLLRTHDDLFGGPCGNRASGEVSGFATPPVDLGYGRVTGRCKSCDRRVSGERRYCGPCLMERP